MSSNFRHYLSRIAFGPDDSPLHRTMRTDLAGHGPGVDIAQAGNIAFFQVTDDAAFFAPVAGFGAQLGGDKTAHERFSRLVELGIHPVVADQRVGHRHNLTSIGGVGQHFLISGHAGIEHDFAMPFQSVQ